MDASSEAARGDTHTRALSGWLGPMPRDPADAYECRSVVTEAALSSRFLLAAQERRGCVAPAMPVPEAEQGRPPPIGGGR